MIHAHDVGRHTSVYGFDVETPALRRFSQRSTVFTNAWSTAPTCSPSRASMLTGRYPHEVGMLGLAHLGFSLERTDLHLSTRLAAAGYRTFLSGVQHEVPDHTVLGYQRSIGADPHGPYRTGFDPINWDRENADAVVEFVHAQGESDEPWFVFWGLFAPHRPFDPSGSTAWNEKGTPGAGKGASHAVREGGDSHTASPPAGLPNAPDIRADYAAFRTAVARMDQLIGEVLDALERSGRGEETIVVVTSDHGIDFPRYKCTLSPGGLGIQLMIRKPGQQTGDVTDALVSNIDIVPTICELAGVAQSVTTTTDNGSTENTTAMVAAMPEDEWTARSFAPVLANPERIQTRRYAFSEINFHVAYDPARGVTDGRYHYTEYDVPGRSRAPRGERGDARTGDGDGADDGGAVPPIALSNVGDSPTKDLLFPDRTAESALSSHLLPERRGLYDLWFDPLQNDNLIDTATHQPEVARLKEVYDAWMVGTGDPLLSGPIPAPVNASVALREAYSSTSADRFDTTEYRSIPRE